MHPDRHVLNGEPTIGNESIEPPPQSAPGHRVGRVHIASRYDQAVDPFNPFNLERIGDPLEFVDVEPIHVREREAPSAMALVALA